MASAGASFLTGISKIVQIAGHGNYVGCGFASGARNGWSVYEKGEARQQVKSQPQRELCIINPMSDEGINPVPPESNLISRSDRRGPLGPS